MAQCKRVKHPARRKLPIRVRVQSALCGALLFVNGLMEATSKLTLAADRGEDWVCGVVAWPNAVGTASDVSAAMPRKSFLRIAGIGTNLCMIGYFYYRRRDAVESFMFGTGMLNAEVRSPEAWGAEKDGRGGPRRKASGLKT